MSKTFEGFSSDRELEVRGAEDGSQVDLRIRRAGTGIFTVGIAIAPSDAPALALAILEAAGHRPVAYDPERLSGDDLLAYIAHRLAVHVGDEAKRTAEAEAQAKLEAEALELMNAQREAGGLPTCATWDGFSDGVRVIWLAVARRAREMAKENQ